MKWCDRKIVDRALKEWAHGRYCAIVAGSDTCAAQFRFELGVSAGNRARAGIAVLSPGTFPRGPGWDEIMIDGSFYELAGDAEWEWLVSNVDTRRLP